MAIEAADRVLLGGTDIEAESLPDWRILFATLRTRFVTGDFAAGVELVDRIAAVAQEMDHHPDVDLRYGYVDVTLTSHDVGGVTPRDVRMARTISALAAERDAGPDPRALQLTELALDTADAAEIKPFWRAVLAYVDSPRHADELVDPTGRASTLWFQVTEPHEEPRQRFHLDVRVPADLAEQRVADALAAGGTLVSDEVAPTVWVLADPQGNKACVTTWVGRSHPGA